MKYILTIGLEIHIKIKSPNKLFCQCKNEQNFDTLLPNTNICPVCTAQPGALPTLSYEPLFKALLLGKVLNCKINKISTFDRKSYFYPDSPMGYQITQLYNPTNIDGKVTFYVDNDYTQERTIGIRDAHIECDTGKMIHNNWQTLIDFNRAGTPLVEIVTNPDFTNASEVSEFLKELQRRAKYNDISDADMDKGQMRIDVNISIRKSKDDPYGTRVELKNINSFGMVRRAIDNEYQRQIDLSNKGEKFSQETRGRNDQKNKSYSMRSKEDALDYRYFPEPDLPPLQIDKKTLQTLDETEVEIPHKLIKIFKEEYGFHKEYINALISNKQTLDYFLEMIKKRQNNLPESKQFSEIQNEAKTIAKRIAWPISAYLKENYIQITNLKFSKNQFIKFLKIDAKGDIPNNQLKQIIDEMLITGQDPEQIIKEKNFNSPALDSNKLESTIKKILEENPDAIKKYKSWKTATIGFLVGQVMKATQGKANPKTIQKIIQKILHQTS